MGVITMIKRFRERLDELFENAPKTNRATELKEELLANLMDKYNDLLSSGKSEEDAFNIAIGGIGDVDELLKGLKEESVFDNEKLEKDRKKHALILSVSIGLYIMSAVILILCSEVFNIDENIGVCLMLTIDAIATCLIIYNAVSRPKYLKTDDTIVEEFKEWKSTNSRDKEVMKSIKSIFWMIIVAIYLLISFVFGIWSFSWIIFIIGAAIEKIITLAFQLKR